MSKADDMVTITKYDYDQLCADQAFLSALYAAGVDSWDGWDYALELSQGEDEARAEAARKELRE